MDLRPPRHDQRHETWKYEQVGDRLDRQAGRRDLGQDRRERDADHDRPGDELGAPGERPPDRPPSGDGRDNHQHVEADRDQDAVALEAGQGEGVEGLGRHDDKEPDPARRPRPAPLDRPEPRASPDHHIVGPVDPVHRFVEVAAKPPEILPPEPRLLDHALRVGHRKCCWSLHAPIVRFPGLTSRTQTYASAGVHRSSHVRDACAHVERGATSARWRHSAVIRARQIPRGGPTRS